MSLADIPEDFKLQRLDSIQQQFILEHGSNDYIPTVNTEASSITNAPRFNSKLVKALVCKSAKSLREARTIYRELKNFNFFTKIQDTYELSVEEVIKMCQYIKYETFKSGAIIFKKGDPAEGRIYLILAGQVNTNEKRIDVTTERINRRFKSKSIITDIEAINAFRDKKDSPRSRFSHSKTSTAETLNHSKLSINQDEKQVSPQKDRGPIIISPALKSTFSTKGRGEILGEAVLSGVEIRGETVIAINECEMIMIDQECVLRAKDLYKDNSKDIYEELYNYLPGLEKLVFTYLTDPLIHLFELVTFSRGMYLTTQGEKGEYFYVIHQGDCDVYKSWVGHIDILHNHFSDDKIEKHFTNDRLHKEQLKLAVAAPGSFVGEEILFTQEGTYDYSVKVLSHQAQIFRIEKNKFVTNFPRESFNAIKKMYFQKKDTNEKTYVQKIKVTQEEYDIPTSKGSNHHDATTTINNYQSPRQRVAKIRTQANSIDGSGFLKSIKEIQAEHHFDTRIKEKMTSFRRTMDVIFTPNDSTPKSPRTPTNNVPQQAYGIAPNDAYGKIKKNVFEENIAEIKKIKFDFGFDYSIKRLRYNSKRKKKSQGSIKISDKTLYIESKRTETEAGDTSKESIMRHKTGRNVLTEMDDDFERGFAMALPLFSRSSTYKPLLSSLSPTHKRVQTSMAIKRPPTESPNKIDHLGLSGCFTPNSPGKSLAISPIESPKTVKPFNNLHKRTFTFKTVTKVPILKKELKPALIQTVIRRQQAL